MFENIIKFFKNIGKKEENSSNSKETAKERLHLVLVQDRANVSVDFLELMKQEIIEVIKKYIEVDENLIDVHLTNRGNEDGSNNSPALYANIPIKNIKEAARKVETQKENKEEEKKEKKEDKSKDEKAKKEDKQKETKKTDNSQSEDTKKIEEESKEDKKESTQKSEELNDKEHNDDKE